MRICAGFHSGMRFATKLLFLLGFVLILSGCESYQQNQNNKERDSVAAADNAINRELNAVKIGMTQNQVDLLLGAPSGTRVSRTSAGKSEEWVYSAKDLLDNAGIDYLKSISVFARYQHFEVSLYFENGVLVKTEGF